MHSGLSIGTVEMTGYCTKAAFLRGKTLPELERLIGYGDGRLAGGATIFFLRQLPAPDDFQLAGYNYFSDGAVRGHKLTPAGRDPYRMENLLRKEGWSDADIRAYKQKMIGTSMVIDGPDRLAKLVPVITERPGEDYPPGPGIFQVRIIRLLHFQVKAHILPGQKWLGDYALKNA